MKENKVLSSKGNVTFAPGTKDGSGLARKPRPSDRKVFDARTNEVKVVEADKENGPSKTVDSETNTVSELKERHLREKAMLKLAAQLQVQQAQQTAKDSETKKLSEKMDEMNEKLSSIDTLCHGYQAEIEKLKLKQEQQAVAYEEAIKKIQATYVQKIEGLESGKKKLEDKYQALLEEVTTTSSIECLHEALTQSSEKADKLLHKLSKGVKRVEKEKKQAGSAVPDHTGATFGLLPCLLCFGLVSALLVLPHMPTDASMVVPAQPLYEQQFTAFVDSLAVGRDTSNAAATARVEATTSTHGASGSSSKRTKSREQKPTKIQWTESIWTEILAELQ